MSDTYTDDIIQHHVFYASLRNSSARALFASLAHRESDEGLDAESLHRMHIRSYYRGVFDRIAEAIDQQRMWREAHQRELFGV